MIIFYPEEEVESIRELLLIFKREHLWETFKFCTFLWLKPCSCPKVSLQYMMWQREAEMPTVQSFNSSHTHAHTNTRTHTRAHTYKSVDFSSLHVVPCLIKPSDDGTASCWSELLHSMIVARVSRMQMHMRVHTHNCMWKPAIAVALASAGHAADLVRDANKGTFENLKNKKQPSSKGSFHCLNTALRILVTIAASDIVSCISVRAASSGLVLIHSQVCSFRL